MSNRHRELAARIRADLKDMERVLQRAQIAWGQARRSPDDPAFTEAVALNLHSFYSGLERLFELLARHVDGVILTGDAWCRDLGGPNDRVLMRGSQRSVTSRAPEYR